MQTESSYRKVICYTSSLTSVKTRQDKSKSLMTNHKKMQILITTVIILKCLHRKRSQCFK